MKKSVIKSTASKTCLVHADPPAAGMEPAARINHWHAVAKQSSEMAVAAALHAGLELFKAKIDHPGNFERWIEANCDFGRRTAYNYLSLIQQVISANALPKIANGSEKMRQAAIEKYAAEMDSKSLTDLYCELGIVKKAPSKMGGKREGAGRKRKDAAADESAALDEAANNGALLTAALSAPIAEIWRLHRERDVFNRIPDDVLATTAGLLNDLSKAAATALKARM